MPKPQSLTLLPMFLLLLAVSFAGTVSADPAEKKPAELPLLFKDGDQAETRLGFVFADSQICSVAFLRIRKEEKTIGEIRFLREMGAPRPFRIPVRFFVQK